MSMPPTPDFPATPQDDLHPEAVALAAIESEQECKCHFVDIGVGWQKVAETPDCPKCTPFGLACTVVEALHAAGMLITADVLTLAQHCKTNADGEVYLAATRVLHRAWKGAP